MGRLQLHDFNRRFNPWRKLTERPPPNVGLMPPSKQTVKQRPNGPLLTGVRVCDLIRDHTKALLQFSILLVRLVSHDPGHKGEEPP